MYRIIHPDLYSYARSGGSLAAPLLLAAPSRLLVGWLVGWHSRRALAALSAGCNLSWWRPLYDTSRGLRTAYVMTVDGVRGYRASCTATVCRTWVEGTTTTQ